MKPLKKNLYWNDTLDNAVRTFSRQYGSLSTTVTTVMDRYNTLMNAETELIKRIFTGDEFDLMLNNALSTDYTTYTIMGAVLADTEDECREEFEYFGVDRGTILAKLKSLTPGQQFALVDYLERLRAKDSHEDQEGVDE